MNILFISETLPINTFASSVVFFRHFEKLVEDGHTITILTDENSFRNRIKDLPTQFRVVRLPNRKWYYLPYKTTGPLQSLRFLLYYATYVCSLLNKENITHILTFAHGQFLGPFAAYVKQRSKLPLITFFHDDPVELNFYKNTRSVYKNTSQILSYSEKVLIASEGFRDNWPQFNEKFKLLYPIPEAINGKQIQSTKRKDLTFGYSGSVYNELIQPLNTLANFLEGKEYTFYIIGNNDKSRRIANSHQNVVCLPLFNTPGEANDYLAATCDLCVIPYPEDLSEMPWIKTCFPSKLIQYCQLSMPTLIIAPKGSALGKWCVENKWLLYCEDYSPEKMSRILKTYVGSQELQKQIEHYKADVFNPINIHNQFSNALQTLDSAN